MPNRRSIIAGGLALAATAGLGRDARAQAEAGFPSRAVRLVVPYAPGGATDIVARLVAEEMRRSLGQPFVVENRPGALGIIAIDTVARSRPDGYTLMVGNVTTNAITPVVFRQRMTLDYEASMTPVARLGELPGVLCATKVNFPPETVAQAMDFARREAGRVVYVTAGVGSYTHFDSVLLGRRAGVEMTHVPFTGGAGGFMAGLMNGDIQLGFVNAATAAPLVKGGQIKALAVVGDARLPDLPDVPTMAEAGYPGIGTMGWNAMFAPASVPAETVALLHRTATQALAAPTIQEAFRRQSIQTMPAGTPEEVRAWLKAELDSWRKIADEARIDLS